MRYAALSTPLATLAVMTGAALPAAAQTQPPPPMPTAAPVTADGRPAEKRVDRRVGKLHDKLRTQKETDRVAREKRKAREAAEGEKSKDPYAYYLDFKKELEGFGITYQIAPTLMSQWGWPSGIPGATQNAGFGAVQFIMSPNVNWDLFTSPAIGSGSVQFSYSYNTYTGGQNGATLSGNLAVLSPVNDTPTFGYSWAQLTYTQELPHNWVQLTAGQYQFTQFDYNQYAGNQQTNFVNWALSQNASQGYIPASLGAYVQVNPTDTVSIVGGLQDGNNTTGDYVQFSTFGQGPWAWFLYGQWTPSGKSIGLGSGQYGVLYYSQPNIVGTPVIPAQPASQGWSINATQNLDANWGLFARFNTATGIFPFIQTSVAGGFIRNNPFDFGADHQVGVGFAWNKTNLQAFQGQLARASETVIEGYWNYTVRDALQVGPSLQVVLNPALYTQSYAAAILTLRVSGTF